MRYRPCVFCPHCGAPGETGWQYCASCGGEFSADAERGSRRQRFGRGLQQLVGTTRKERLTSALTALVVLAAAIGGLALWIGDGDSRDDYLAAVETRCAESYRALSVIAEQTGGNADKRSVAIFAAASADVVDQWQSEMAALDPPESIAEDAGRFGSALDGLELSLQTLAGTSAASIAETSPSLPKALDGLDRAAAELGVPACRAPAALRAVRISRNA